MPALVYVLAISGAIHLVNHYREAILDGDLYGAAGRAIEHGWKPAFLCSLTTAFGLISLYGSDLGPISKFGTYSALAMMLMLFVLFAFLPAALQFWKPRLGKSSGHALADRTVAGKAEGARPAESSAATSLRPTNWLRLRARLESWNPWAHIGSFIIRHHVAVSIACMAFIVAMGLGLTRVRTTIDLLKLFDGQARILQDYRWLESNVGRLVPMEIAVQFAPQARADKDARPGEPGQGFTFLERLEFISAIQQRIEKQLGAPGKDVVGPSLSAVTFVPPLPTRQRGMSAVVRRTTLNSQLQQSYDALLDSGYLAIDKKDGDEIWRISLRVAAFKDVDYGRFSDELRRLVDPAIAAQNEQVAVHERPAVTAIYTGVVPIVYKAQRALLESLIKSTVWSFLTITPLLMLVCRGARAGLVAMLPNVLPVLVVFGGMGWLGQAVDIGSMMSASIALGVAVDDTIHYLTWFRDDLKRSRNRHVAILAAYERCATPTTQASLINGLGLSVFALSTFVPTKQFGLLMLTILIAGLIAELILLPALLAGPLGRVFEVSPKRVQGPTAPSLKTVPEPHRPQHSATEPRPS
jgi:predicted RND superfamily exporter protein